MKLRGAKCTGTGGPQKGGRSRRGSQDPTPGAALTRRAERQRGNTLKHSSIRWAVAVVGLLPFGGCQSDPMPRPTHAREQSSVDSSPDGRLLRAERLKSEGRLEEALSELDEAIRGRPNWAQAHEQRALVNIALHRPYEAIVDLSIALRNDADPSFSYHWRGVLRRNLGDHSGAIADLTSALSFRPTLTQAYSDRAEAWIGQGEFEKAVSDATTALEREPEDVLTLIRRARAWQGLGQLNKAEDDLDRAISIDPLNAMALNVRAEFYVATERYAAAIQDCKLALTCSAAGSDRSERILQCLKQATRLLEQGAW